MSVLEKHAVTENRGGEDNLPECLDAASIALVLDLVRANLGIPLNRIISGGRAEVADILVRRNIACIGDDAALGKCLYLTDKARSELQAIKVI